MAVSTLSLMLVLATGAAAPLDAVHRYALLIGSNVGAAADVHLQYAVRDATQMSDVLTQLGGFASNDVAVLADPTAESVRTTFAILHSRIDADGPDNSVLFVYYSGHADAINVHLGANTLAWEELLRLTNHSGATTRLLVVDACRSGQATRVKGSRLVTPFSIANVGPDLPQGFAVLASASADENAQESDSIGGSIFTHHFLAALRGAADTNNDGRVSLTEAFEYSADRTMASSADTLAGVQHASYRYRLRGRGELALTQPAYTHNLVSLNLAQPGEYYVRRNNANGSLATEAVVHDGRHQVWLPAGKYFIQRRTKSNVYEGNLELRSGQPQSTSEASFEPVAIAQLATKGGGNPPPEVDLQVGDEGPAPRESLPSALSLWVGSGGATVPHFPSPWTLGLQWNLPLGQYFVLDTAASFANSAAAAGALYTSEVDVGLGAGVRAVAHLPGGLDLSGGLRLGGLLILERYSKSSLGNPMLLTPTGGPVVRIDWHLPQGFFLGAEGQMRVVPEKLEGSGKTTAVLQPLVSLGIGHTL